VLTCISACALIEWVHSRRGAIELASVPAAAILASTHSLRRCPLQSRENSRVRLPPCQKHWRPALSYSGRNDASRAKLSTAKRALPRCTVSFHHAINRNEGVAQDVQSAQYHQQARLCPATWWGIVLANLREAAQRHTGARPRPGELVSELGRAADVTRGMLALTVVALVGLFTANPDVPVGLSSDIVGEG